MLVNPLFRLLLNRTATDLVSFKLLYTATCEILVVCHLQKVNTGKQWGLRISVLWSYSSAA